MCKGMSFFLPPLRLSGRPPPASARRLAQGSRALRATARFARPQALEPAEHAAKIKKPASPPLRSLAPSPPAAFGITPPASAPPPPPSLALALLLPLALPLPLALALPLPLALALPLPLTLPRSHRESELHRRKIAERRVRDRTRQ